MYYSFISNVLNVLFLCGIIIWINLSVTKKYSPYFLGIMFGLITILMMNGKTMVAEGHFHDFRNITLTMAGFIGGPLSAAIAALISLLYLCIAVRIGFTGVIIGIIVFAVLGIILGEYVKSKQNEPKVFFWLGIGLVLASMTLFILGFLTPRDHDPLKILQVLAVPYLIITPLATTIIFNFYFLTYEFFGKASILNAIINRSHLNLMVFDTFRPIMVSNNLKELLRSSPRLNNLFNLTDMDSTYLNNNEQLHKEITIEHERQLQAHFFSFQMPNGENAQLSIVNEVTEIKRLETEKVEQLQKYLILEADLSRSNQMIADIINSMPDNFYVLDYQGKFIYVNNQAEELLQKSRESLLGQICWDIFPQARGTILELYYLKAKIDGLPFSFEHKSILHKEKWYQISGFPSKFGLSVHYRNITEQKIAHENLLKSKEETISILESMTDSFFAINSEWEFTYINGSAERAFGKSREELLGKKLTEVFKLHDTSLINYQAAMNEKRSITYEIVSEMIDNKWLEIKLYPIDNGLTIYFQDISGRKKSEEEMARLDRLNLVGQLAAGIGHEIRNPMTTVRGYLQLLSSKPEYTAQNSIFELMISELDRANSIITEFLSLSQTRQSELQSENLNNIISHLYPLLEADAFIQNKQICFKPTEIPNLDLNAKEISQVILNLARNGLEAMQEKGCLTLESCLQDDKVILAIQDEGCGIPPENMHKLGTPFFTTKDYGTGLGLATCYKIVEAHNAKICVESNPQGTIFYICFPVPKGLNKQKVMIA